MANITIAGRYFHREEKYSVHCHEKKEHEEMLQERQPLCLTAEGGRSCPSPSL